MAVDSAGNVYVADHGNDRVQKFTAAGTFLTSWGTPGTGPGQFDYPHGVAVDADRNVYVTDLRNDRMQEFTSTGTFLTALGSQGSGDGQFNHPSGVAVDSDRSIYVTDAGNRVQKFRLGPRPDGRIRNGSAGAYVGNNVYNTTGAGQTRNGSAARGQTVTYEVSVQNDAPMYDRLRLKGTATSSAFAVRYSVGGVDVTPDVIAGTYLTPTLPVGSALVVRVDVKVKSGAPPGAVLTGTLITKSDTDTSLRDTVKFVTHRS